MYSLISFVKPLIRSKSRQMFFSHSLIVLFILFAICSSVLLESSDVMTNHRNLRPVIMKRQTNASGEPKEVALPTDLCSDPNIYTIDRMSNGTVRIYRDYHYWDLEGVPDKPKLNGPFLISWEGMAPITQKTKVMTTVTGENAKSTFRFESDKFWAYNSDGKLFIGKVGQGQPFPVPMSGFLTAVFFNGNESNPLMLGFRGVSVIYYKFKAMTWQVDGNAEGYPQGRNNELFPGDLNTAFAVPLKTGYEAYLFKNPNYCQRKEKVVKVGRDCDSWKENKHFFGCYAKEESPGVPLPRPESTAKDNGNGDSRLSTTTPTSAAHYLHISFKCLPFIFITFLLNI